MPFGRGFLLNYKNSSKIVSVKNVFRDVSQSRNAGGWSCWCCCICSALTVNGWGQDPDLEVHCSYNLLSNCSYNPSIFRVTVVMGLIIRL